MPLALKSSLPRGAGRSGGIRRCQKHPFFFHKPVAAPGVPTSLPTGPRPRPLMAATSPRQALRGDDISVNVATTARRLPDGRLAAQCAVLAGAAAARQLWPLLHHLPRWRAFDRFFERVVAEMPGETGRCPLRALQVRSGFLLVNRAPHAQDRAPIWRPSTARAIVLDDHVARRRRGGSRLAAACRMPLLSLASPRGALRRWDRGPVASSRSRSCHQQLSRKGIVLASSGRWRDLRHRARRG